MSPDIVASKHAQLLKIAKAKNLPLDVVLTLYMSERLLYRLSQSALAGKFVLKGGLLLYCLFRETARPTKDIDMLAAGLPNDPAELAELFRQVCSMEFPDGVRFDPNSIKSEVIREGAAYQGVRLSVVGTLGKARGKVQLDIGYHDVVVPDPIPMTYPVFLDDPAPVLSAYSLESVIAEKFEAMVLLGEVNSRMKDIYDIHLLACRKDFSGLTLSNAVSRTIQRRQTKCPEHLPVFQNGFAADPARLRQWQGFLNSIGAQFLTLPAVMDLLRIFLSPLYDAHRSGVLWTRDWDHQTTAWR